MHTSPTPTPTSEIGSPVCVDRGDGGPASPASPLKDLSSQDFSPLSSLPYRDSREDFNRYEPP